MMFKFNKISASIFTAMGLFVSANTFAAFPEGQWTVYFYSEVGLGTSVQGICLASGGTWYGTTFSAWGGVWNRKSNDIHIRGNYASGDGNDGWEMSRVTNTLLTGYYQEWRDSLSHNDQGTMRLVYKSAVCDAAAAAGPVDGPDFNPSMSQ
jgi:hypothetical protein